MRLVAHFGSIGVRLGSRSRLQLRASLGPFMRTSPTHTVHPGLPAREPVGPAFIVWPAFGTKA